MKTLKDLLDSFSGIETSEEHNGYFFSVGEALTIVILGSLCGLRNVSQIHQWASNKRVSDCLMRNLGITRIPCYYWMLCLLKMIKPESFNRCFINWVQSFLPDRALTISFDGKTIRSTEKMDKYESPLHIVSAQIADLGITFGQIAVNDKSNEIPAMRELLELLQLEGCIVVADALNCQKDTARTIIKRKADYLLCVKDNQSTLKKDIEDYVQDPELLAGMDSQETVEKNNGRIEHRTAYATCDIGWLPAKDDWENLACIGAINRRVTGKKGTSDEWHYYISSRALTAEDLLRHARMEWSVETMHWLLDTHFAEDFCRIEDKNTQQSLNMARKIALNTIKLHKERTSDKRPISKIMLDCLLDCDALINLLDMDGN